MSTVNSSASQGRSFIKTEMGKAFHKPSVVQHGSTLSATLSKYMGEMALVFISLDP